MSTLKTAIISAALACTPCSFGSEVSNPLFGYSHLSPSPYTLSAGRLLIGTSLAYGLTDFLQLSTEVIPNFYKIFNAQAKVSLIDFPEFALAVTFGFSTYNLGDISPLNPDLRVTNWEPGIATATALHEDVAWLLAGRYSISSPELITGGIEKSSLLRGVFVQSDLAWVYNRKKKSLGNVLATGVTYDVSYELFGVGVSHHWPGFHLGVHYYPNADRAKVMPIFSGGAVVDL